MRMQRQHQRRCQTLSLLPPLLLPPHAASPMPRVRLRTAPLSSLLLPLPVALLLLRRRPHGLVVFVFACRFVVEAVGVVVARPGL